MGRSVSEWEAGKPGRATFLQMKQDERGVTAVTGFVEVAVNSYGIAGNRVVKRPCNWTGDGRCWAGRQGCRRRMRDYDVKFGQAREGSAG